jgi:hypothetical protein
MAHFKSALRGTFVYSFTTGVRTLQVPDWRIRNDTDALAHALYLERRGKQDEAERFLEVYLEKQR